MAPLALWLPPLIVGQALGLVASEGNETIVVAFLIVGAVLAQYSRSWFTVVAALAVGFFSYEVREPLTIGDELVVVGEIVQRVDEVGPLGVVVDLALLGIVVNREISPIPDPPRVRATIEQVPWRGIGRVEVGHRFLSRLRCRTPRAWFDKARAVRTGIQARCRVDMIAPLLPQPLPSPTLKTILMQIVTDHLTAGEGGVLVLSMAFGVRGVISERTEELFRATGLAHLLVLSGFQISLLAVVILWLGRSLSPRWLAPLGATGAVWFFVMSAGGEPSAVRAAIAVTVAILASLIERQPRVWNRLAAGAVVVHLVEPLAIISLGVQLSFGAVAALLLWSQTRLPPRTLGESIPEIVGASLAATAVSGLILVAHGLPWSWLSLIANPVLGGLLGALSFFGGVAGVLWAVLAGDGALLQVVGYLLGIFIEMLVLLTTYPEIVVTLSVIVMATWLTVLWREAPREIPHPSAMQSCLPSSSEAAATPRPRATAVSGS